MKSINGSPAGAKPSLPNHPGIVKADDNFQSLFEKYNLAVKAANFGIWEFNYLTETFYWDEAMEAQFGCKIETVQQFQEVWLNLVSAYYYNDLILSFKKARKTGSDFHYIFSVQVDGVIKYIECFAAFKFNPVTNRSETVTGVSLDITEKKLAAIALENSEERYRMLADNALDIIVFHLADGTVDYLSPSAIKVLGITLEDAKTNGGLYYVHPHDVELVMQHNKASIKGEKYGQRYECRLRDANGKWFTVEVINKAVMDAGGKVTGILSAIRNISDRKAAEENYRLLAENITDIVGILNLEGKFEYISPSVEKELGYTQQELTGHNPMDDIHPDDIMPLQQNTIAKNLQGKEGFYSGYRVRHKEGHWVYFEIASRPVLDKNGNVTAIIKSSRNITERVLADKARQQSDDQYKLLADNIGDYVVLATTDFKRLYVSPSGTTLTGFTTQELLNSSIQDLLHPDDAPHFFDALNNTIFKGENQVVLTGRILRKDGRYIYTESVVKAIRDNDGNLVNILATLRDITRQHEAEEARFASDQHYKLLADNIGDFVLLDTPDLKRVYVSPSGTALTGYSTEELLDSSVNQVMHPDDLPVFFEALNNTIYKGDNRLALKNRLMHKDGHIIYVESLVKAVREKNGELKNLLISVRDISKQHQAEMAVRESEQKYRLLADNIIDLILLVKPDFGRIYVSPSCYALTGYTHEEYMLTTVYDIIYKDDQVLFFESIKNTIFSGEDHTILFLRLVRKDGSLVYVESFARGIRDSDGKLTSLLFTIKNIDNQRKAELALRESEQKYRMLADNMSDLIILHTPDFKRAYVSPSALELTGFSAEELLTTRQSKSIIHPDDVESIRQEVLKNADAGNNVFTCYFRGQHKNGDIKYFSAVMTLIRDDKGALKNILTSSRDITGKTLAETAKKESEEKYRLLADNMSDLVILYAPNLTKLYISPSCKQFTGYTQEEAINLPPGGLVFEEDREQFNQKGKEFFAAGHDNFIIKHRCTLKGGGWKHVSSYFTIIKDDAGGVKNVLVTVRDVHAETLAQLAMTASEEKYKMLADNMFDMLLLLTPELKRVYVSPSAFHLTGYTADELIKDSQPLSTVHPDDREYVRSTIANNIELGINKFVCQYRLPHKKGNILQVSSLASVVRDKTGAVKNIVITTRDITPEKTAQTLLANSEEKYRSLVEASENIILMMDEHGKYLFANAVACKYVQKTPNEVIGKTVYDFFDKATADFYVEKIKTVLNIKQAITFEYKINLPGASVWLRNTLNPIFDLTGKAYAAMLSLIDFTEIKNYSEKLRLQNEELKKIAHLQSHIVRAPLANIEGILSIMNEDNMSPENRKLFSLLKKSALQLDQIVKDIVEKAIDIKHKTES